MSDWLDALRVSGRCISVIGSGGKTTLLRRLSERMDGTVILTTSTRVYPFPGLPLVAVGDDGARALREIRAALERSRVICVGRPLASGKLAGPEPAVRFDELLGVADAVLVEADGAAGKPLKAHRPWEPVIPACSDMAVCVVGASGLGRTAAEACHCPELFCALAGTSPDAPVDEAAVARALNREALSDAYLVNQVDALDDPGPAARLCALIRGRAVAGSLIPPYR